MRRISQSEPGDESKFLAVKGEIKGRSVSQGSLDEDISALGFGTNKENPYDVMDIYESIANVRSKVQEAPLPKLGPNDFTYIKVLGKGSFGKVS